MRRRILFSICLSIPLCSAASSQDVELNLLPKYGSLPKTAVQKAADDTFLRGMAEDYHGDRKKAAQDMALRGWQYLASGYRDAAMRRFNQAWLLDNRNGTSLWGMGAIEADRSHFDSALHLFAEARPYLRDNANFAADYAKLRRMAEAARKNPSAPKSPLPAPER